MNVLVVNAWHDDNRGDMALVHSALLLLQKKYPQARINVISMIPEGHKYWQSAHLSLQESFPELSIIPSALPMEANAVRPITALRLGAAFLSMFVPWFSRFSGYAKEVKEADLIVSVGGHYLFSYNNNLKSLFRLLRLTQPFTLGLHLNKKVVLFSQSLGPYQGKLAHKVVRSIFAKAKCIVRESLSKELITSIAPDAKVEVKPDSAFYLSKFEVNDTAPVPSERYAVFTLREPMKGDVSKVRISYMEQLKGAGLKLLEDGKVDKIYVFPHVTGPTLLEDDRKISRDFSELCNNEAIELLSKPLSLPQTLAFYREASFVVGTRFHSVVFALSQGTPAVALSYYGPKAQGIMRYIGMEELCFDIDSVTTEQVAQGVEQCLVYLQQGKIDEQQQRMVDELETLTFSQ